MRKIPGASPGAPTKTCLIANQFGKTPVIITPLFSSPPPPFGSGEDIGGGGEKKKAPSLSK